MEDVVTVTDEEIVTAMRLVWERAKLLIRLAALVEESREKLARVVVAEQGKPLAEAYGEIEGTALYLTYAAEEARRISGDILPSDEPNEQVWIQRVAHGVVAE